MNPEIETQKDTLESLLRENNELQKQTVALLQRQEKRAIQSFWFRVIWIAILLGLPFLLIPYMLASFTSSMGLPTDSTSPSMIDTFKNAQDLLQTIQNQ